MVPACRSAANNGGHTRGDTDTGNAYATSYCTTKDQLTCTIAAKSLLALAPVSSQDTFTIPEFSGEFSMVDGDAPARVLGCHSSCRRCTGVAAGPQH